MDKESLSKVSLLLLVTVLLITESDQAEELSRITEYPYNNTNITNVKINSDSNRFFMLYVKKPSNHAYPLHLGVFNIQDRNISKLNTEHSTLVSQNSTDWNFHVILPSFSGASTQLKICSLQKDKDEPTRQRIHCAKYEAQIESSTLYTVYAASDSFPSTVCQPDIGLKTNLVEIDSRFVSVVRDGTETLLAICYQTATKIIQLQSRAFGDGVTSKVLQLVVLEEHDSSEINAIGLFRNNDQTAISAFKLTKTDGRSVILSDRNYRFPVESRPIGLAVTPSGQGYIAFALSADGHITKVCRLSTYLYCNSGCRSECRSRA